MDVPPQPDDIEHDPECPDCHQRHHIIDDSYIAVHIEMAPDGPMLEVGVNTEGLLDPKKFTEQAALLMMFLASEDMIEQTREQLKFFLKSCKQKKLWKVIEEKVRLKAMERLGKKSPPAISPIDIFRGRR